MLCRQMWTGNPRMPRVNHRGNASLPALLHSDGRIPPRTLRAFDPPRSIPRVTSTAEDLRDVRPRRQQISMALAVAATLPALILRLGGGSLDHPFEALAFGAAVVGAAFLLSWAAEAAQLDISAGLAIAVLAFIAVLPEY